MSALNPKRVTAFLDYPPETVATAAAYWSAVTGYALSPARGELGELTTLVPPRGADYLRVQAIGEPRPRVHLGLVVDDREAAVTEAEWLGASFVDQPHDEVTIMRSPGGLVFCLVPGTAGERPAPSNWPSGLTSYVDQVCLDIPPGRYDAEVDFWAAVTGWARRDRGPDREFGRLTPDADQPLQLLIQRLDDEQDVVTAHLDWSASDREAEVARHVAAGAQVHRRFDRWTVLRDPAGMTYCITRRKPGDRPGAGPIASAGWAPRTRSPT